MRLRPPTLLWLIFTGYVLVALPLIGTIVTAILQVDGFASDSRQAVGSVQENASASRLLADRITELERSARQYHALSDATYKQLYSDHRIEAQALLDRLIKANANTELLTGLEQAKAAEIAAYEMVEAVPAGIPVADLESAFGILREKVVAVVQAHNAMARDIANSMPGRASSLQRLLLSQAVLVIPLSVVIAAIFGTLIARPVHQIDQSIRSLGRGALSDNVLVRGTRDLEEVGLRLEWLRLRLIDLEAQKAQFLRNVSHELKTPLTNIREGAKLLLDDITEAEKHSITNILHDNSLRLQQMIEELLRYGADGDLSSDALQEKVHLAQLVDDVLEQSKLALVARSVKLKVSMTAAVVRGNTKRLRVIIDNLISNAVKYTPVGGQIEVTLRTTPDKITLDVHDNGPGISEQDKPHLFEWFHTGPRPPDAVVGGTGIGLAIAREYAQQNDGEIELIDSAVGAHFRLTLQEHQCDQS